MFMEKFGPRVLNFGKNFFPLLFNFVGTPDQTRLKQTTPHYQETPYYPYQTNNPDLPEQPDQSDRPDQ